MMISRQMAAQAAELLGLALEDPALCAAGLQQRFRDLAKAAHPDAGGTTEQFVALDRAKCILERWLARPRAAVAPAMAVETCIMCDGTGKRQVRRGFKTMTMVCGSCRGAGERVAPEKVEE